MPRSDNLYAIPDNLPILVDDGACSHLLGMNIPSCPLISTTGKVVDLGMLNGTRYEISADLSTPVGRQLLVRTVWQIDKGTDIPRLITLIPD